MKQIPPSTILQYVIINFSKISMFKTNYDGTNSDGVEDCLIRPNTNSANNNDNIITMNVNFINFHQSWNIGCSYNTNIQTTGFYDCYLDNRPYSIVSKDIFEDGLQYTFNFQIGDVDAKDEFDNGLLSDFTYTEQVHTSIK